MGRIGKAKRCALGEMNSYVTPNLLYSGDVSLEVVVHFSFKGLLLRGECFVLMSSMVVVCSESYCVKLVFVEILKILG